MSVDQIAQLYVYFIEPALKVLAFFVVVITVLYLLNMMGDSKKKVDLVNNIFNIMIKSVILVFTVLGRAGLFFGRLLLRIINLLIATVSDFFTSKI